MLDSLFTGRNGFIWFFGNVEDNGDPMGHGRARVRIHGHHTFDTDELPTQALPWAVMIAPATHGGIAGIGRSPTGVQVGSRVVGFFLDGEARQQPAFFGTLFGDAKAASQYFYNPEGTPPLPALTHELTGAQTNEREHDCEDGDAAQNPNEVTDIRQKFDIKVSAGEWNCPTTGFISSPYGRRGTGFHRGVDICPAGFYRQTSPGAAHLNGTLVGGVGNPVTAAADGEVIYLFKSNRGQHGAPTTYDINKSGTRSFGNAIILKHKTQTLGDCLTVYAHLGVSQDPGVDWHNPGAGIQVKLGQKVSKGEVIGTMGRTHCWDVFTHLHFEIRRGTALPAANNTINPGLIFPQMYTKHSTYYCWVNGKKWSVPPGFDPAKAPVKQGDGPKS